MRKILILTLAFVMTSTQRLLLNSDNAFLVLFLPGLEGFRELMGKWKAWRAFEIARVRCPAYASFLAERPSATVRLPGWGLVPDFSAIPPIDKANYVRCYPIEQRCLGGQLPTAGCIDESSGSTGEPTDWVRGAERKDIARVIRLALRRELGPGKPVIFLNGFALGPWATGMNVSGAVIDLCLIKSLGPDVTKIIRTLRKFGPEKYRYIIGGYPPFLAAVARSQEVDWSRYECIALYGGEGMSEGMRAFLEQRAFRRVLGDYGASDLEINIAAESPFTIALRQLMAERPSLRQRLNRGRGDGLPMLFQYNPLDYVVETNEAGELVVTLTRAEAAAPKIRYNIHDLGHALPFSEVKRILAAEGIALSQFAPGVAHLPVLFLYGRSDLAVAFYGCKITPGQVEQAIFSKQDLSVLLSSFALIVHEDDSHDKRLIVAMELVEGAPAPHNVPALRDALYSGLAGISQDFREAVRMVPPGKEPALEFHAEGTGPFAGTDVRLKRNYIRTR